MWTICCSACSGTVVYGKTSNIFTRNRIGEQREHDFEGQERLQARKHRRDFGFEIEANRAPVASENEGDPARKERQDVEMPVETFVEFASVKRGSDVAADNKERDRCDTKVRAPEARNTKCKTHWNPRSRREPQHFPDLE